jgi:uncharacterized membrane protein (DUF485 family)
MVRQQEDPPVGWHALYASPEFRRLASVRSRFVRRAVVALLGWGVAFLVVVGAAPAFAGQPVVAGMTVGFVLGLSQFVLAWWLTWRYLRLSESVFSPLEDAVVAVAVPGAASGARP